jgi:hypothetical protein
MVERNLLAEGFITNTLAPGGSISGTQVLSIGQMEALVDGNIASTAVAITGTFFVSLDADLGARWKLDRIELYTDEPNPLNFNMRVSVDNVSYFPLTMTGSAGLWTSTVSGTTVSGAPRYLRYDQAAPALRNVYEWKAINDEDLVDFGTTGSQTTATIEDAPIGNPSEQITELKLFNRFSAVAQGYVFIDETGNKGDDNIEIALNPSGPWFGKRNQNGNQPLVVPWVELEYVAVQFGRRASSAGLNQFITVGDVFEGQNYQNVASNLRVVSGTAYRTKFETGLAKGWTGTNFLATSVVGRQLYGEVSTTTTPSLTLDQAVGNSAAVSPDSVPAISNEFAPFRAEDYDTIEVELVNPSIIYSDLVEGPRLFWKVHHTTAFATEYSTLSTTPNLLGNGSPQTVRFEMGSLPTWSGVVTALQLRPWTTATGIGMNTRMNYLEVYKDGIEKKDRLALDFDSVVSGTFTSFAGGSTGTGNSQWSVIINVENVIKEPCVITSVSSRHRPNETNTFTEEGWFLCRFRDGFLYKDRAQELNPAAANPFIVKQTVYNTIHENQQFFLNTHVPVYWQAVPGDMIGYAAETTGGFSLGEGRTFAFDSALTTTTGGAIASASLVDMSSTATLQNDLNALANWNTTGGKFNIQFKSVSAGKYLGTGEYFTPIFDGGGTPALLSFEFESQEDNGTSIDVGGGATLDTIYARASATTPDTSTNLGRQRQAFMLGAHPTDLPSQFDARYTSNYVIGLFNAEVTARENEISSGLDTKILNTGVASLWHEVNQEWWVLNVLLSGSINTNMRPIWDVYDLSVSPPNYLRTQHVLDDIGYTHSNDNTTNNANAFEVVGFCADYDREEIYIITREDEFKIGSAGYHGIILDLNGNYKDVFWRSDQLTQDMVDATVATSTANAFIHLSQMRTVTYKDGYFYALTSSTSNSDDGTRINVYRLGNNPSDPENVNDVEFISSIVIGSIAGIPVSVSDASPVDIMTYCAANDLFYLIKDDGTDLFTLRSSVTGSTPTESVIMTNGPISQTGTPLSPQLFASGGLTDGFSAAYDYTLQPWQGQGEVQQYKRLLNLTYCEARDTFLELVAYSSRLGRDLVRFGHFSENHFLFKHQMHTVLVEMAADASPLNTEPVFPKFANRLDPLWGTTSGSLTYLQVAENSILFPTGRYAQLRYQLNANTDRTRTPYLIQSRLNQGLRVSDIPASGTKTIYLRTNIPDDEVIGDQSTNLKVYWELVGG